MKQKSRKIRKNQERSGKIKIMRKDIKNILIIIGVVTAVIWIFTLIQPITNTQGVVNKFGQDSPVLIEVYADWCKYCNEMKPIVERFQKEHPEIKIKLINVDENNIKMSLPRFIIVQKNGTYTEKIGAMPEEEFKLWVLSNYK